MINKTRSYIKAIPFSEHVPDLTSKEDIPIIKSYLEQKYPSYF